MLPALARTHFGLCTSTLASLSTTPPAPAASAARTTVPALPGSRTCARTATSAGRAARTVASGTSTRVQTASSPWGVTVSLIAASTWSVAVRGGTPASGAASSTSGNRAAASAVVYSSRTTGGRPAVTAATVASTASVTACGPSATNRPSRRRAERPVRRRTARTRSAPGLDRTAPTGRPIVMTGVSGGGGLGGLGRRPQGRLRGGDESGERDRVVHGELGKDAAVDLDAGDLEALDEAVVRHAVLAGGGVDALDPQPAEVALARLAVAVGVDEGVGDLLLRLAVQPRALPAVTAGELEDLSALLVGVDRPLHACHVMSPRSVLRGTVGQITGRAGASPSWRRPGTARRPSTGPGSPCWT